MLKEQDLFTQMNYQRENDQYDDYPEEDQYDSDAFDDDSPELLPCPNCGEEIYEESERCPYCGEYVTFNTSLWSGKPTWWIVLGVVGILATVLMLMSM